VEKSNQTVGLHPLLASFKSLWGINGDILALQYAGYISEMNENLLDRCEAIERFESVKNFFFGNIFQENYKNHCIKLLLKQDVRGIID